ncbi:MAG TPA: cation:proton antiporter [Acidothermaceae bacterium]|nr:cation:proton antiporter [Acidothermaceae bacterium]
MGAALVLLLLLAGVAILVPLADRRRLPSPAVMALYGIVLALIPGIPGLHLAPKAVLPLLLPPLLFAAAQSSSTQDFARHARGLLALAVGLVLVSTAVVAAAAHLIDPRIAWAPAIVLGALVAPPDPVAATSLAGRLHLPRRVVEILEGEGLLNDATSLITYTVAVSVALGSFTALNGVRVVLVSVVGAPLIGYAVGRLGSMVIDQLKDPRAEVTLTLLLPYTAYLATDVAGGSGVLAVVVTGLYVGQRGIGAFTPRGYLTGTTVWSLADWLVSSLAFGLIGFELTSVLKAPTIATHGAKVATVVVVAAIGIRALFVVPLGLFLRHRQLHHREGISPDQAQSWRESALISFAGMRGVVTFATAMALPNDFPNRPVVLFSAIVVVLVTLVAQGFSLPVVVRALHVEADDEEDDVEDARRRAVEAALDKLDEMREGGEVDDEVANSLSSAYRRLAPATSDLDDPTRQHIRGYAEASRELHEVERSVVLDLRSTGQISARAAQLVLRDLQSREERGLRQVAATSTQESD